MKPVLKIQTTIPFLKEKYNNHSTFNGGDSGLDLFCPETIILNVGETKFLDLGVSCEMTSNESNISYYLYPRSSIAKTPLILANSVGIIDAGYRGNLIAAVKYVPTFEIISNILSLNGSDDEGHDAHDANLPTYTIEKGTRLFQICSPNLQPFNFELVNKLTETERGSGGFGSTG